MGAHVLLLFHVLHQDLGVVSIREEVVLSVSWSLYTFFGLLIAIMSCMSATIVSHYAWFLRYVTLIMLYLLFAFRILLIIILLLLFFNSWNLLLSLSLKVWIILLIQIDVGVAYLLLRQLLPRHLILIMILKNTFWWSLVSYTFTSLMDHILNVISHQGTFKLVLIKIIVKLSVVDFRILVTTGVLCFLTWSWSRTIVLVWSS